MRAFHGYHGPSTHGDVPLLGLCEECPSVSTKNAPSFSEEDRADRHRYLKITLHGRGRLRIFRVDYRNVERYKARAQMYITSGYFDDLDCRLEGQHARTCKGNTVLPSLPLCV